mgnify:CR=1 FL=1
MLKRYFELIQEEKIAVVSATQAIFAYLGSFFSLITIPTILQFLSAGIGIIGGMLLARKSYYDTKKVKLEIENLLKGREDEET